MTVYSLGKKQILVNKDLPIVKIIWRYFQKGKDGGFFLVVFFIGYKASG